MQGHHVLTSGTSSAIGKRRQAPGEQVEYAYGRLPAHLLSRLQGVKGIVRLKQAVRRKRYQRGI